MPPTKDDIAAGLERLSALFAWWEVPFPGGNGSDARLHQAQRCASELLDVYAECCRQQIDALAAANERLVQSFQKILRCRRAEDAISAQSSILTELTEESSRQIRAWIEVTQKLQACWAALASESEVATRRPSVDGEARKAPAHHVRPAPKEVAGHRVHA